jgi:thioredoxin 1
MPIHAAAAPAAAEVGGDLVEVDKDNYFDTIAAAGSKLVVVDCYTDWCGPCKLIKPTLVQWAAEMAEEVEIVKFNCNKNNKELGMSVRPWPNGNVFCREQQGWGT